MEHVRAKLKEKDGAIEKKSKLALAAQLEKKRIEGELGEIQERVDTKERKIGLMQRKVGQYMTVY